jgi:hypothetical protein
VRHSKTFKEKLISREFFFFFSILRSSLKIHNVFVPTYNSENQKGKFLPQAARKYQSALEEKKIKFR